MDTTASAHRLRRTIACSPVVLAACLAAFPAAAQVARPTELGSQQADQDRATTLDEIVVTARKVSENMQDVPVAITAFSGQELQAQNAVKVTDIGRLTPGITFRQSSTNPSGLLVSMRGQFQRDTVAAQDPSVGTYVDGVYWARSYGLNADLLDISSAQILKGPQGTLFGRSTTGGAVLLETNNPNYSDLSGMGSVLYGRFNEVTATGVLNLPLIEDRVALRGALQINQRDGYITDFRTGQKYDNRDNITGRLKLGIHASDTLNLVFSAERYRFDQDGQARSTLLMLPSTDSRNAMAIYTAEQGLRGGLNGSEYVALAVANPDLTGIASDLQPVGNLAGAPRSHYETQTYASNTTLDTGIGTFKLIAAYRGVKGSSLLDLDGGPWNAYINLGVQDLEQYSAELQLTGKRGAWLDYVVGVFGFKEEGEDTTYTEGFVGGQASASATVRVTAATRTISEAYVENKSSGAYAQMTWHPLDRLNLTGGLRYSTDERGATTRSRGVNSTTLAVVRCDFAALGATVVGNTCTPVSRSEDFSNWSYLASADYRLTDDILTYLRFSKGYRSGGQQIRATTPAVFVPFQPEIAHDIEVGVKAEMLDRRLRVNVAGYRSTIDGAQRSTRVVPPGGGPNITILGNAAQVRVMGLEGEATAALGGGFRATLTGAYTDPKYLSYTDATGDRTGERFNGVPEKQASFMVSYARTLETGQLNLRADYSWASATPLDEGNAPASPFNTEFITATTRPAGGEANVRATLDFDDGRYEIAAYGRNIFDNRDLVASLSLLPFGFVAGQHREPATYGIQLTYHFNQ